MESVQQLGEELVVYSVEFAYQLKAFISRGHIMISEGLCINETINAKVSEILSCLSYNVINISLCISSKPFD